MGTDQRPFPVWREKLPWLPRDPGKVLHHGPWRIRGPTSLSKGLFVSVDETPPPSEASGTTDPRTGADRAPSLSLVAQRVTSAVGGVEPIRSFAVLGLLVIAVFAVLRLARTFFIPLVFASLLFFLLRPLVRGMGKLHIPQWLGAAVLVLGILGVVVGSVTALYEPASEWMQRVPAGLRQVERKIGPLRAPMRDLRRVAERVEQIADVETTRVREVKIRDETIGRTILSHATSWTFTTLVTLIVLYLMLLSGESFMRRLMRLSLRIRDEERASAAFIRIEHQMSAYIQTIVAINVLLGAAVAMAMKVLDMPNPALWGVLAFALNFVPYLGSIVGGSVVALVALISLPNAVDALVAGGAYVLLSAVEGSLITPVILGRRLRLNPLVIFVWLVFWGWLWGISGAILAVPLLMLLKVVCEQTDSMAPVADLLER